MVRLNYKTTDVDLDLEADPDLPRNVTVTFVMNKLSN